MIKELLVADAIIEIIIDEKGIIRFPDILPIRYLNPYYRKLKSTIQKQEKTNG